ncbi:hypothetical protein JHD47_05290 [Sulfurimonas sp. SAG-AH-194-L11]|nr:hypothetical protein [Sulfurimonas sp. SAG-AH-194-L11]MDF1877226.1 hypothetical protein [Sulfurimonas sp. SAG-AH-194-L11]
MNSELNTIHSTCVHCSAGCTLEYEMKDGAISSVKNSSEFASLCPAGNFGFDFDNINEKNKISLQSRVNALKDVQAIRFSSMITNEEVHILQLLKEKFGIKLFNEDARLYGEFMSAYSSVSAKLYHSASLDSISQVEAAIVIGGRISTDNPAVRYALSSALDKNSAKIVYAHPIEDVLMQNSTTQFIKYEAGSEEGVMALLANELLRNKELSDADRAYFDDLDLGYIEAESNVGADELELMSKSFGDTPNCVLIIGSDVFAHKRAKNIAKLAAIIEKYTSFSLLVIPSEVNTVGVSLIADLDKDEKVQNVISYNSDLTLATLNQQKGTVIGIDNKVLRLNITSEFDGYTLEDVVNELGLTTPKSIDYSKIDRVDDLRVSKPMSSSDLYLEEVAELPEYNGTVIYHSNPIEQFNVYTNVSSRLKKDNSLRGSAQFAAAARISNGDLVEVDFGSQVIQRVFKLDEELKGTIALNPSFDIKIDKGLYKFLKSNIMRVEK